jgi:hypothetical protein
MTNVNGSTPCLLCSKEVEVEPGEADEHILTCKRCGKYRITKAVAHTPSLPADLKSYLSAAARQAYEAGSPILFTGRNFEGLAAPHRSVTVSQRVEKVLRFVAVRCRRPGVTVGVHFDEDFPVADCSDGSELIQYLEYLEDETLIRHFTDDPGDPIPYYAPTIKGWKAVEPTVPVGGEKGRCFVAMWFDDGLDSVYAGGFEMAVRDCGFDPYCVKAHPTNESIPDKILSEITRAQFVVADFTGDRHNVYYEAGFARGIGREVIGCCREDWVEKLKFDTRHRGHVIWKDTDDLRQKLADSIRANIIPKR